MMNAPDCWIIGRRSPLILLLLLLMSRATSVAHAWTSLVLLDGSAFVASTGSPKHKQWRWNPHARCPGATGWGCDERRYPWIKQRLGAAATANGDDDDYDDRKDERDDDDNTIRRNNNEIQGTVLPNKNTNNPVVESPHQKLTSLDDFLDQPFFDPDQVLADKESNWWSRRLALFVQQDYETAELWIAGVWFGILIVVTQELLRLQMAGWDQYVPFATNGRGPGSLL